MAVAATFADTNAVSFGVQLNVAERLKALGETLGRYRTICVKARTGEGDSSVVGVVLVLHDGSSYTGQVQVHSGWQEHELSLSALRPADPLLLPNSYPRFLPRTWRNPHPEAARGPDLRLLNSVQILVDPRAIVRRERPVTVRCEIVSITLME